VSNLYTQNEEAKLLNSTNAIPIEILDLDKVKSFSLDNDQENDFINIDERFKPNSKD
jgi:hypothetical protein